MSKIITVRTESFANGKVNHLPLQNAINTFGRNELMEYVNGYNDSGAFFVVVDGEDVDMDEGVQLIKES